MANTVTNRAKFEIGSQARDLVGNAGVKVMLLDNNPTVYTISPDTNFVDEGGASDVLDAEYSGAGYTGGFGGAERKALASKAWTEDDGNDRGEFDAADLTWSSIGGGSETIDILVIIDETGASADTDTEVIALIDSGLPVTTNGGDVTVQWNAEGLIQIS